MEATRDNYKRLSLIGWYKVERWIGGNNYKVEYTTRDLDFIKKAKKRLEEKYPNRVYRIMQTVG